MTIEELKENREAIEAKFGKTNIAHANVSQSQLSIARHYGGAKIDGRDFVYNPKEDTLIRADVVKWFAKQQKAKA